MKLKEGAVLTKVSPYYLQSPEIKLKINVHEVIAGSESKFIAVPVDALGVSSNNRELHVEASTEVEALELLLAAIYELPNENILPKRGS